MTSNPGEKNVGGQKLGKVTIQIQIQNPTLEPRILDLDEGVRK